MSTIAPSCLTESVATARRLLGGARCTPSLDAARAALGDLVDHGHTLTEAQYVEQMQQVSALPNVDPVELRQAQADQALFDALAAR